MTSEQNQVAIAAICGSLRETSYTRMALQIALRGAREAGAATHLIDLRDYDLPFCDGSKGTAPGAGLARLRRDVSAADGILIGTPEYHGSLSGVLKNALDLMGFEEFEGKMIGLVSVSGGALGGVEALNTLRTIGRALHAWVLPAQVAIPQVWKMFDDEGVPRDTQFERRLLDLGRDVARFAHLHRIGAAPEFLRLWETAPVNPGGTDR